MYLNGCTGFPAGLTLNHNYNHNQNCFNVTPSVVTDMIFQDSIIRFFVGLKTQQLANHWHFKMRQSSWPTTILKNEEGA